MSLERDHTKAQKQLQAATEAAAAAAESASTEQLKLQGTVTALTADLDTATQQTASVTAELQAATTKWEELETQLAGAQQEMSAVQEQYQACQQELQSTQAELVRTQAAAEEQETTAARRIASLEGDLLASQEASEEHAAAVDVLAIELQRATAELECAAEAAACTNAAYEATVEALACERATSAELRGALATQEGVGAQLRADMAAQAQQAEAAMAATVASHESTLADMRTQLDDVAREHRKWFNEALNLRGNIRVFCRVRPLADAEAADGERVAVKGVNKTTATIGFSPATGTGGAGAGAGAGAEMPTKVKAFSFDRVFSHKSSQQSVFEEVEPMVTSVLDGYNATIFAYGQVSTTQSRDMLLSLLLACAPHTLLSLLLLSIRLALARLTPWWVPAVTQA